MSCSNPRMPSGLVISMCSLATMFSGVQIADNQVRLAGLPDCDLCNPCFRLHCQSHCPSSTIGTVKFLKI